MNPDINSSNYFNIMQVVFMILTGVITIIGWIISKPSIDEIKFRKLRKNLLISLKFKLSLELTKLIPIKEKDILDEDYYSLIKDKLNSYLEWNSDILIDYHFSELIFKSIIRRIRFFKYGIFFLIVLALSLFFVIPLLFKILNELYLILSFFSVLLFGIMIIVSLERKKDKFNDLCTKHEAFENET